ncbi:hypothetical protein A4X13_0g1327 [Tilletia indica]|uniref:Uncharacterized protein n=1 Tax=Tilletia indica TaxID=43049 RepID=A0A177TWT8_9BASI|nr:hypothetical protein A4X13_0g1327 [Tilletia indica]
MSLHHFLPPHPSRRGERIFDNGRSKALAELPIATGLKLSKHTTANQVSLRHQHLRKVFDILQLSLLRGDGPRAARALRILVRAKEWRHADLWRYGLAVAGLLGRDAALEGSTLRSRQVHRYGDAELSSARQKERKLVEEAATTRRLAYLRGLYRAKPMLRSEVLVDIVFELIELKRYDEAMREIEYVLDSHPFRNCPTLHLLAGILTLDSALRANGQSRAYTSSPAALADLPAAVRRAAEHHFRRTLTAARKDEADKQYAAQTRIEIKKRRDDAIRARRRVALQTHLETHRATRAKREETLLGDEGYAPGFGKMAKRKKDIKERVRQRRARKAAKTYAGPLKWAYDLAKTGKMPDSEVDEACERVAQDSAMSDEEEGYGGVAREKLGRDDLDDDDDDDDAGTDEIDMMDVDRTLSAQNPGQGLRSGDSTDGSEDEHPTLQNVDADDEGDEEDDEEPQGLPSAFATAVRLLEGWSKSDNSRRPSTWESHSAQLYLDVMQPESS